MAEEVSEFTTIIQSCLIRFPIPNTLEPSSKEGACTGGGCESTCMCVQVAQTELPLSKKMEEQVTPCGMCRHQNNPLTFLHKSDRLKEN